MAVNIYTLDRAKRTVFYRVNQSKVPVLLPFQLVAVDTDLQYYEPVSDVAGVDPKGRKLRGEIAEVVYLKRNMPLPRPAGGLNPDKHAVFAYYGI